MGAIEELHPWKGVRLEKEGHSIVEFKDHSCILDIGTTELSPYNSDIADVGI